MLFESDRGIKGCWLPPFLRYIVELDAKDVDLASFYLTWVEERVVPSNRIGLKRILKMVNMHKYDVLELARKTNVCQLTDPYWLAYSESDCFTKNSLRGLYGHPANPLDLEIDDYRWKI